MVHVDVKCFFFFFGLSISPLRESLTSKMTQFSGKKTRISLILVQVNICQGIDKNLHNVYTYKKDILYTTLYTI